MPGLTDSSARHLLHSAPTRRLLASSQDKYKYDEVEGFLRLTSGHQRKGDPSYRSITASKHDAYSEDDTDSSQDERDESSDDESDTTPMTSLQATLKTLEEQLAADPTSINTWLSLLSHTLSTVPIASKNAPKARSEITLSILQRALSAHPQNASSKALRLRYLKAGEETWHESKLRAEWEDALKVGGIEMWIEWLDWRIRKAEKGVDGVVEDAKRVLAAVRGDGIGVLRVQWRVAVGFRDAGYIERANALFQAQAELYVVFCSTCSALIHPSVNTSAGLTEPLPHWLNCLSTSDSTHLMNFGNLKPLGLVKSTHGRSNTGQRHPSATLQISPSPGKLPHSQRSATHTDTGQHPKRFVTGLTSSLYVRSMKPPKRTHMPPSSSPTYARSLWIPKVPRQKIHYGASGSRSSACMSLATCRPSRLRRKTARTIDGHMPTSRRLFTCLHSCPLKLTTLQGASLRMPRLGCSLGVSASIRVRSGR